MEHCGPGPRNAYKIGKANSPECHHCNQPIEDGTHITYHYAHPHHQRWELVGTLDS